MAQVFISYAREDQDFAEVVQAKLERAGHKTSLDLDLLRAGDDWGDKLDLGIRSAHALVLIVTPEARRSDYVAYEWAFALGAGVRLIALDLTPSERHPRLDVLQRLDFTNKARPWESLLAEVARAEQARAADPDAAKNLPPAVQQAIRALNSLDAEQRRAGVMTLAKADGEAARRALAQALRHPLKDVRAEAARRFPDRKDPRIVRGLFEGHEERWEGFSVGLFRHVVDGMAAAAVPDLLALLDERATGPAELRAELVEDLGNARDSRAAAALMCALRDPAPGVRAAAAGALGKTVVEGAAVALRGALADPADGVRREAARALGQLGDRSAAPALLDLLAGDMASVRLAATRALGQVGDVAAAAGLKEALRDRDADVQVAAAEALGRLGDPAGPAYLQAALAPDSDEINGTEGVVMRALVELDVEAAFPIIEKRLGAFRSGSQPTEAISALRAHGPSGVLVLSRVLAKRQKDPMAAHIAEVLRDSDDPRAREALRQWRLLT